MNAVNANTLKSHGKPAPHLRLVPDLPPLFPTGPGGGPPRCTVALGDDGEEMRVELAAGALGPDLGHDRLAWGAAVVPSVSLTIDVLAEQGRRRRGEPPATIVTFEALGLGGVDIVSAEDATVVVLWLTPSTRRWARSKRMSLTEVWHLFVTRLVWVRTEAGTVHPTWEALATLDWSGLERRKAGTR